MLSGSPEYIASFPWPGNEAMSRVSLTAIARTARSPASRPAALSTLPAQLIIYKDRKSEEATASSASCFEPPLQFSSVMDYLMYSSYRFHISLYSHTTICNLCKDDILLTFMIKSIAV